MTMGYYRLSRLRRRRDEYKKYEEKPHWTDEEVGQDQSEDIKQRRDEGLSLHGHCRR